jgi:hypothetical protein
LNYEKALYGISEMRVEEKKTAERKEKKEKQQAKGLTVR